MKAVRSINFYVGIHAMHVCNFSCVFHRMQDAARAARGRRAAAGDARGGRRECWAAPAALVFFGNRSESEKKLGLCEFFGEKKVRGRKFFRTLSDFG